MGFKEEILMTIYRSITLSQYLYNAPLLGSASTEAKKEMEKQQHRFFNIIGITSARALEVYKIEPISTFLDHQCVNVVERILKESFQHILSHKNKQLKVTTIQEALSTSQQLLEQKHTRTAAYKKHSELKEMDMSTNTQTQEKQKQQLQNISLLFKT
jgi:hypothetical protein